MFSHNKVIYRTVTKTVVVAGAVFRIVHLFSIMTCYLQMKVSEDILVAFLPKSRLKWIDRLKTINKLIEHFEIH